MRDKIQMRDEALARGFDIIRRIEQVSTNRKRQELKIPLQQPLRCEGRCGLQSLRLQNRPASHPEARKAPQKYSAQLNLTNPEARVKANLETRASSAFAVACVGRGFRLGFRV